MSPAVHRACIYSSFGCLALFLLGFGVIAGFIPPPSPDDSAREIAETFRDDRDRIRGGMIVSAFAAALMGPWVAAIAVHLRRIEGHHHPLTYIQLGFGMLLVLEFIFPMMLWQTATFRTERSDEAIQTLNDMAWIPFEAVTSTVIIQCIAIGVAILNDPRESPLFPRWAGYLNFWVALAFAGGSFNVFFKDGPLAWPGVIAWWVPLVAFPTWLIAMAVLMLRQSAALASEQILDG